MFKLGVLIGAAGIVVIEIVISIITTILYEVSKKKGDLD